MDISQNEKLKAAYALNLFTVSIKQIIDYNDINIMQYEYDTIINNLNLEKIIKDEALLDVIRYIMDEIDNCLKMQGDRKFIEKDYKQRIKNAIWSAVPNVGAIFSTSNPVAMGVTLATQVGIGYMNYRRNKADIDLNYERSKWEIQKNRMDHLNGLRKQLFETAWRLADNYKFPDEYRLTESQIEEYNIALTEANPIKRFNLLNDMRSIFDAYPIFWYQIGSVANSIYRDEKYSEDIGMQAMFKEYAIECFSKYGELNKFNLLRHDTITSAWALEFIELLDLNHSNQPEKAREYIQIASKYSKNQSDVIELCAFASLRIQDYDNAMKFFETLLNRGYNISVNTQILSGLYIKKILSKDSDRTKVKFSYDQLKHILDEKDKQHIIPLPPEGTSIDDLKVEWNRNESLEEYLEREAYEREKEHKDIEEAKNKAKIFYQKRITLVFKESFTEFAEYSKWVIESYRDEINSFNEFPITLCNYEDYKKNRNEKENLGGHIIFIGKSSIADNYINSHKLDYDEYGIKYVTDTNKTYLVASYPKDYEISDLIELAKEINERHHIRIPYNFKNLDLLFLKELSDSDSDDIIKKIVGVPQYLIEQIFNGVINLFNFGDNESARKIEFLQYCVGLYLYLESENAIID
ncbi:hypothetical protein HMPREF9628_00624 [Peptoanaerobacter stomatis]|uniref:Tetratricopeptide repeat protein n=1 Tax=Peptoanaerobacter stomatis TaxID=796937 RepID=G9XFG7_9FIRM|nr:hypothetical protein [Peptoanaerobacter stomatis]EHL16692.1 hypothetical protein HMPREF9628_00624 [Peptoanaerobacter stomatis]